MSLKLQHPNFQNIKDHITGFYDEMVAIRQDLHAHPELAYEEHRTSDVVAKLLKSWGYEVETHIGKTGVVGRLKCGASSKTIGLRADFDALPIEENTNLPYASKNFGKMHACGHDGHTAMLLAAARYLSESKKFDGTLNLIFQPAEENFAGAKAMMDDGLFSKFPCDKIFALHNWPDAAVGYIGTRSGIFMPSSDTAKIIIHGKGGHGALPDKAVDPIAVGAILVAALQTIVSRNVPAAEAAVITVGSFHAGFAANVIPDDAEMLLTIRCFTSEMRDLLQDRIEKLAKTQAESFGATAEVIYQRQYPLLVNHHEETQFALDVARASVGVDNVNANVPKVSGSEDFAFMLEECPGCYLVIGNGESAPLHNPKYNFNDALIPFGSSYFAMLTESYLR